MDNLKQLNDSAVKVDFSEEVRQARKLENLFPCETQSPTITSVKTPTGTPELDKEFKRIDLKSAMNRLKKQKGIPFLVPEFAAFDVSEEHCLLQYSFPDGMKLNSPLVYEALEKSMKKAVLTRLFWLYLPMVLSFIGTLVVKFYLPENESVQHWYPAVLLGLFFSGWLGGLIVTVGFEYGGISLTMGEVLPNHIRNTIKYRLIEDRQVSQREMEQKFTKMFIVTEAGDWSYCDAKVQIKGDPLLVGYRNKAFYLVEMFDMMPADKWLEEK